MAGSSGRRSVNTIISAFALCAVGPYVDRLRRCHWATNSASLIMLGAVYVNPCSTETGPPPYCEMIFEKLGRDPPGIVRCTRESRVTNVKHERRKAARVG